MSSPAADAASRRSRAAANRREQILEAAITVFARKGFHATRVSDIADEAGIAYGLVYHYFPSKEDLLTAIFSQTWAQLVQGLNRIDRSEATGADKIGAVVHLMFGSYRLAPDLVRVLILEITRSDHLRTQIAEIHQAFEVIERIVAVAQVAGEFRSDVPAGLASYVVWGAIDEMLTAWVLQTAPSSDAEIAAAESGITAMLVCGLRPA